MADRYDDERRWRRWGEGRRDWDEESKRDWLDDDWRNRPYSRREEGPYREQDWRSRQGRMGTGSGYGPSYDREFDREQEWGRGRDWERGQGQMRGGTYDRDFERYGRGGQDFERGQGQMRGGTYDRDFERYGRGGQDFERYGRGQDWGQSERRWSDQDWERDQGPMRGRQGRDFERKGGWDYDRTRSGYGSGSGRSFDRDQERYGRGMTGQGQYDRYRDMDREEDWDEWDEPATTWTYAEYWFVPGPYAGIGPRNYNRSDETILEEVCERLSQHGQVDASEIEVEIQDGDVILKGSVNDRREKRLAEDIAESVFGIVDVQNHLRTQDRQLGGGREPRHDPGRISGQQQGRMGQQWSATQDRSATQGLRRDEVRKGMEVIGRDGENIGEVKEVRSNDFLVDRPMARDVYVPFSSANTSEGRIRLHISASDVDNQDWDQPDILSTEEETGQKKNRS
jgi:hypothetical protein